MNNYISWDEYFMSMAILSSKRSKDPNTKVGACIVSMDKKVLSVGYNGMPIGIDDKKQRIVGKHAADQLHKRIQVLLQLPDLAGRAASVAGWVHDDCIIGLAAPDLALNKFGAVIHLSLIHISEPTRP